jgi:M6 family metalloprotease-like protein
MSTPKIWRRFFFLALLVPALLRAQTVRSGVLTVLWGDPSSGSIQTSRLLGLLTGADGTTTRIALTPELLSKVGGLQKIDRRRVEVTLLGSGFDRSEANQVEDIRVYDSAASLGNAAVLGAQPWVSILCKFSDVAAEPKNLNYFLGMYANAMGGLDHYWRQVSYNQINVAGSTAAGWVTLPHPRSHYFFPSGSADLTALANDCTAAADPLVDFSNGGTGGYVGINMMFNDNLDCCAWGGARYATLDGVTKVWSTTWEPPWGYSIEGVMAHEMGHGFGLPHSNNSDDDGWPYDNPWDVMSDTYGYALSDSVYGTLGKHTISYHKDFLGWIPSDRKVELLKNGIYSFTLDSLAVAATSNYRMAKIRMPGNRSYTVEARKHDGYDGALAGEAVLIHEVDLNRGEPAWLVDADNPPATYSDNEGVMWRPGETFVDPSGQFLVEVDGAAGAGFNVTLTSNRSGPIYQEGFESGSGGFYADGLWHRTAACEAAQAGHSTPTAFYFGIDAQCNYSTGVAQSGWLSSSSTNLGSLAPPLTLTFNYFLEAEPGGFDQAQVYIYKEGGPFQLVASNTPGSGVVTLKDPSGAWQTASIDLQPYAGLNIWLYFYFASNSTANNFAGFYLDDIAVWSCFSNEVLNLVNQTIGSQQTFRACDTVTAGQNFNVVSGGDVTFRAGKSIELKAGFAVNSGGAFTAVIGAPEQ